MKDEFYAAVQPLVLSHLTRAIQWYEEAESSFQRKQEYAKALQCNKHILVLKEVKAAPWTAPYSYQTNYASLNEQTEYFELYGVAAQALLDITTVYCTDNEV